MFEVEIESRTPSSNDRLNGPNNYGRGESLGDVNRRTPDPEGT